MICTTFEAEVARSSDPEEARLTIVKSRTGQVHAPASSGAQTIRCPGCNATPGQSARWTCDACSKSWNTFATRARCPRCGKQYLDTQCPSCSRRFDHEDWYVNPEPAAPGKLVFVNSVSPGIEFDKYRHTLLIRHEGSKLVFDFSSGPGSTQRMIASERRTLEQRVDAALQADQPRGSMIGCRFCGHITPAAAESCSTCGAAGFN